MDKYGQILRGLDLALLHLADFEKNIFSWCLLFRFYYICRQFFDIGFPFYPLYATIVFHARLVTHVPKMADFRFGLGVWHFSEVFFLWPGQCCVKQKSKLH